jgi:hypothetical protein
MPIISGLLSVAMVAMLIMGASIALGVIIVHKVLRYSEGGAERREWLLRVGTEVVVPALRVETQRLQEERLLAEEQRAFLREAAELSAQRRRMLTDGS